MFAGVRTNAESWQRVEDLVLSASTEARVSGRRVPQEELPDMLDGRIDVGRHDSPRPSVRHPARAASFSATPVGCSSSLPGSIRSGWGPVRPQPRH